MNSRRPSILFLAAVLLPALLFAAPPKLTRKDAIRIANESAKRRGIDLSRYKSPDAYYEFTRKNDTWSVFYVNPSGAIGDHFFIVVHDKTKKTEFAPGE